MTFAEADAQYEVVKQQHLSGALDAEQFDEQLHRLMVLDDTGRWWAKSRENGAWHFYDSGKGDWIAATPPASPHPPPLPPLPPSVPVAAPSWGQPKPASSTPANAAATGAAMAQSPALPSTSQGSPTTATVDARDLGPQPELTGGTKMLFYAVSLLLPILGVILYFVYRNKPALVDRTAARAFLILGIASIVFSCMCSTTYFLLESTMLGTGT